MDSRRFTALGLSIFGLFAVRFFESDLFYDPLIDFFREAISRNLCQKSMS